MKPNTFIYDEEYLLSLPKSRWKVLKKEDNVRLLICKIETVHGIRNGFKVKSPYKSIVTFNSLEAKIAFKDWVEDLK